MKRSVESKLALARGCGTAASGAMMIQNCFCHMMHPMTVQSRKFGTHAYAITEAVTTSNLKFLSLTWWNLVAPVTAARPVNADAGWPRLGYSKISPGVLTNP